MSNAAVAAAPASARMGGGKCPHCNGKLESVATPGRVPFHRCTTCGRDDRSAASLAPKPGTRCTAVDGCPGVLDARSECPCCLKRAAWVEAHVQKRYCKICNGAISGRGGRTLCEACRPVSQKASVAKHYESHGKPKRG